MFNSGCVNCGECVEFGESDGWLYENINYKINMKNKHVKI